MFFMTGKYTFPKAEKLSSRKLIGKLFEEGKSFLVYPVKVVYLEMENLSDCSQMPPVSVLISVSRKKFKRAVHRNRIKRLIRECYRLNKQALAESDVVRNKNILVGLIYIGDKMPEMVCLQTKIISVIRRLLQEFSKTKSFNS